MTIPRLNTERLVLRGLEPRDAEPLIAAYADDCFARHITAGHQGLERGAAWRALAVVAGSWALNGFGMWAVELRETRETIGHVGPWQPPGWPGFEIGWAIVPGHEGKGFATEAAAAAMAWTHAALGRDSAIHLIDPANAASERVAQRLGATVTGRHVDADGSAANIWTTQWDAFAATDAYRRHIAASGATA